MLPEAYLVFLDELLNANSAILNSLLMALNERVFRRGRETRALKALMFVGASNRTPEDDALKALYDRFLLRVHCDNVAEERLPEVLRAGWKLAADNPPEAAFGFDEVEALQDLLPSIDLAPVQKRYVELVHRIRQAGIPVSDRRAVKLQNAIASSAILCGRSEARMSDLWVLRFTWETEEQQEVLRELVEQSLRDLEVDGTDHPRARGGDEPDAEELARELAAIASQIDRDRSSGADSGRDAKRSAHEDRLYLRDRLAILDGRCQWVTDTDKRELLTERVSDLWRKLPELA
jgi:MoxR-like ATPase